MDHRWWSDPGEIYLNKLNKTRYVYYSWSWCSDVFQSDINVKVRQENNNVWVHHTHTRASNKNQVGIEVQRCDTHRVELPSPPPREQNQRIKIRPNPRNRERECGVFQNFRVVCKVSCRLRESPCEKKKELNWKIFNNKILVTHVRIETMYPYNELRSQTRRHLG